MTGYPGVKFPIIMYDAIRGYEIWACMHIVLRFVIVILEGNFASWSNYPIARTI